MQSVTPLARVRRGARIAAALAACLAPRLADPATAAAYPAPGDVCTSRGLIVASAGDALAGGAAAAAAPAPAVAPEVAVAGDPQRNADAPCTRPEPGSPVAEPTDLRSVDGELHVELRLRNERTPGGAMRYCYLTPEGAQSPTLRVHPGDLVVVGLTDALTPGGSGLPPAIRARQAAAPDPCQGGAMSELSTNLHFHGMTMPPVCHQDEVLKTLVQAGDPRFEYRFRVPGNEQPGLYWYHAHAHGLSMRQVLGGASGAIVVEGIERANPALAGLPERVLVIRDQDLLHPQAVASKSEPVVPKMLVDHDGDTANNGTGFGRPAKDLSVNFVPVPFPDYPPARLEMRPGERQLWRVLNASAITYLNLALVFDRRPHPLEVVAIDGAPLTQSGKAANGIIWSDHIGLPPGARAEFIVTGPPAGVTAQLVTRAVDTGQGGENDPNRALVSVVARADAAEPRSRLSASPVPLPPTTVQWLGDVAPVRVRRLYFSERPVDPANPGGATDFYITVDGQTPARFDPHAPIANIVAHQGDVEDWIIENRTPELHAFHIHQTHFLLMDWSGRPVSEPFLRDTVNVPYFNGRGLSYPSVRLRMDFRDPNTVGTFVYHCHLLDHEDGGMMGVIRVDPPVAPASRG